MERCDSNTRPKSVAFRVCTSQLYRVWKGFFASGENTNRPWDSWPWTFCSLRVVWGYLAFWVLAMFWFPTLAVNHILSQENSHTHTHTRTRKHRHPNIRTRRHPQTCKFKIITYSARIISCCLIIESNIALITTICCGCLSLNIKLISFELPLSLHFFSPLCSDAATFPFLFSRFIGRRGHYTTHQDGGFVTKDLRAPVQRGEDDAVWAVHPGVRRLQDHQGESPGSPDRTRFGNSRATFSSRGRPLRLHPHVVFHFQRLIMDSSCLTMIPGKESGSNPDELWITTCWEME